MAEEVLLVVTGSDRPGIMDVLSEFLLACGGNIIDSRSALLRGRFSLLFLVRGEAGIQQRVEEGLSELRQHGVQGEVHSPSANSAPDESAFPFVFTATGKDQVGVLHRISHLMRVLHVNIDNMQTRVTADQTFQIRLELAVPRQTPVVMLRDYLTYLCNELGIKGELKEA